MTDMQYEHEQKNEKKRKYLSSDEEDSDAPSSDEEQEDFDSLFDDRYIFGALFNYCGGIHRKEQEGRPKQEDAVLTLIKKEDHPSRRTEGIDDDEIRSDCYYKNDTSAAAPFHDHVVGPRKVDAVLSLIKMEDDEGNDDDDDDESNSSTYTYSNASATNMAKEERIDIGDSVQPRPYYNFDEQCNERPRLFKQKEGETNEDPYDNSTNIFHQDHGGREVDNTFLDKTDDSPTTPPAMGLGNIEGSDHDIKANDASTTNMRKKVITDKGFSAQSKKKTRQFNTFEERCNQLLLFKKEFGHCFVPSDYPSLGRWCSAIAKARNLIQKGMAPNRILRQDMIERLEEIGFHWNSQNTVLFEKHCRELEVFKEEFGHCNVPQRYPGNPSLGHWCRNMRTSYHRIQMGKEEPNRIQKEMKRTCKLSQDRIKRLEEIGFQWHWNLSSNKTDATLMIKAPIMLQQ